MVFLHWSPLHSQPLHVMTFKYSSYLQIKFKPFHDLLCLSSLAQTFIISLYTSPQLKEHVTNAMPNTFRHPSGRTQTSKDLAYINTTSVNSHLSPSVLCAFIDPSTSYCLIQLSNSLSSKSLESRYFNTMKTYHQHTITVFSINKSNE